MTSEIEKKLVKLDEELHSILEIVRGIKKEPSKKTVESVAGAWGYKVDSREFVEKLRKSKRLDWAK
jgi:hypothetical protein